MGIVYFYTFSKANMVKHLKEVRETLIEMLDDLDDRLGTYYQ
jgi:hypothetical protein